jgi:CDP-diacylglycerol--glycerol-3-phosphate 3-phosphatidyltransferase
MLMLFTGNPILFLIIYLLAGITDVADGYIARKYGWISRTGALLDSLADSVFYLVILLIIGIHFPSVITDNLLWISLIFIIKLASVITSLIRFKKIVFVHTLANKSFGLILFFIIPLILFPIPLIFIRIVFISALLPAIEEILILLISKYPEPNRKSIFIP